MRQRLQAAIQPLGLETRSNLQEQQIVFGQPELAAEVGTDFRRIGRCPAIR